MAWISVHQQIRDHRKLRELSRILGVTRQEALGILVLIWTWAIDNCNQDGKLLSITVEDIALAAYWTKGESKLFKALVDTGWLDESEGEVYLHDWYDFNKPFYDFRERREKDKERKRKEKIQGSSTGNSKENPHAFRVSPSQSPSQSLIKELKDKELKYIEQFEVLWKLYPNKKGRKDAEKKAIRLLKEISFAELQRVVIRYADEVKGKNAQYIKHGSTFFNSGYADYLDENYTPPTKETRTGVPPSESVLGPREEPWM